MSKIIKSGAYLFEKNKDICNPEATVYEMRIWLCPDVAKQKGEETCYFG